MKKAWELKRLNEVLKIQNGYAFNSKLFTNEKGTPLIRIRDIKNGIDTETNFNGSYDKKYEVRAGDFLIGMDGEFGCYEWKGGTALLNQRVCRLQEFSNKIYSRFLFYGINKYLKAIEDVTAYVTVKHISSKQIENIEIPLPPLPEQKRIVAILDEAFAAVDKAKANAEKNLQNAKELFESYMQEVFENKGADWEEKTLGQVTNVQRGSSPRPKGDPKYFSKTQTKFNWITISDISSYCEKNVLLQTREWLTEAGSKQSRYVDENEFIIAVSGSTTGKCCITGIKGFIYDGLAVLKIINNAIEPEFLLNYMMSLYSTINNSKAGAAFPNINTNYLNNLPISFPPLKQQQTIVRQLSALRAETQKLEAVYQQKIVDLEELKKSILQKAFTGELTYATEKAIS